MEHDFFLFSNSLINRTCSHFYLLPLGVNLQLTLEQRGFEMCVCVGWARVGETAPFSIALEPEGTLVVGRSSLPVG